MPTICPGQDTRYWRPTDIFEVSCAGCGAEVEFFKDDVRRRCHLCGAMIQNPKISLGCAQWCEHAKACLGYDPKEELDEADQGAATLLDQLITAVKGQLVGEPDSLALALHTTEEAEELLRDEPADRRAVLASALLSVLGDEPRRQVMAEVGLDDATRLEVKDLTAPSPGSPTAERRVLDDARRLVELRQALRLGASKGATEEDLAGFETTAGRARATKLLGEAR